MSVDVHQILLCELVSKAGADNLSAVKAEDGINDLNFIVIVCTKVLRNSFSLGKS